MEERFSKPRWIRTRWDMVHNHNLMDTSHMRTRYLQVLRMLREGIEIRVSTRFNKKRSRRKGPRISDQSSHLVEEEGTSLRVEAILLRRKAVMEEAA
jgi:hypothetical protein